jgi:nitrogen fixation/metabolism regulation signal transduction histidine kinase
MAYSAVEMIECNCAFQNFLTVCSLFKGETVASLSSVNALQASIAQAERQVQTDQSRVSQDASRLEQSRAQLSKDRQTLSDTQQQSAQAAQPPLKAAAPVQLDQAIEKPSRAQQTLPPDLAPPKPQVNTLGQTIGKLINIVA